MGKVGSRTIEQSLKNGGLESIHTHSHEQVSEKLMRHDSSQVIITGFREPLSRTISAYFENISNPEMPVWYFGGKELVCNTEIKILIERFQASLQDYIRLELGSWLAKYCQSVGLGSQELPRQKNVILLERKLNNFWIYKLEHFEEFERNFFETYQLGALTSFSQKENMGKEKWYSSVYENFLANFRMSEKDYLSYFLACDWVRHFYTQTELLRYARPLLK